MTENEIKAKGLKIGDIILLTYEARRRGATYMITDLHIYQGASSNLVQVGKLDERIECLVRIASITSLMRTTWSSADARELRKKRGYPQWIRVKP